MTRNPGRRELFRRPGLLRAQSNLGLARLRPWPRVQLLAEVFEHLRRAWIVRQVLQLLRIILFVIQLRARVAVGPFGVTPAVGADRAAGILLARDLRESGLFQ